jgi:excisionase family DNA binding protein
MKSRVSRIPAPVERHAYTVNEACSVLRVSRATAYELMKRGKLKYFYVLESRRIPATQINALVKEEAS